MTKIVLSVPNDYKVPALYETADRNTVALALTLGAKAFEAVESEAVAKVRGETHAEAVEEAVASAVASWESQVATLRREKRKADEALEVAKARLEALDGSVALQRAAIQKEARESVAEVVAAKDEQIQRLQSMLDTQLGGLATRFESLQTSLTKSFTSSKEKGTVGEVLVEGLIKKAFDCDVSIISKEANTADIRMTKGPGQEYLWEVKNYTRMVSTEEVEKFRRDLRLHPEIRGGIMVSLRTGIVGHSRGGDIDIEFLADGRCIVFLSNLMAREDVVFYLQMLRPLFQVLEAAAKPVATESDALRALETKAALIANLLRSHAASVAKHKNALVTHRKRMDSMFAEFGAYVLESETQLQTLLRVATGSEAEAEEVEKDAETYLSALVFQKQRLSDLEGRTKSFVGWLLESAVAQEGSQIEIKEMLDRAKERGFGEKFVRDLREDVFQGTAWARGARFILGLKWL
jgi:uncharacterized coiled-coil protein SlyX